MELKTTVRDLQDILNLVFHTVDKTNAGLSNVHISAKNGKVPQVKAYSNNHLGMTWCQTAANVITPGEVGVDPVRLSTLLDRHDPKAELMLKLNPAGTRLNVNVGRTNGFLPIHKLDNALRPNPEMFPAKGTPPLFRISAQNLKILLEGSQGFAKKINSLDGDTFSRVLIRSIQGGYEALATNREVVARPIVLDDNAPATQVQLEIPGMVLPILQKIAARSADELITVIPKIPEGATRPSWIYFQNKSVFFGAGLFATPMPDLDQLFNEQSVPAKATVAREELLNCIHRSSPFTDDEKGTLLVNMASDRIGITTKNSYGEFSDNIPAKLVGVESSGKYSQAALSEVLRTVRTPNITFGMGTTGKHKVPVIAIYPEASTDPFYVLCAVTR